MTLLVTLGLAGSLGAVLYGVTSSVPYLVSSPLTDAHFGALNACARRAVPARVGFAVAPDGRAIAAFSGAQLVRCETGPDGGVVAAEQRAFGITAAAFDAERRLWLARDGVFGPDAGFPDVKAVALAGVRHGVIALEASGRLYHLREGGVVAAIAQLPRGVEGAPQLLVSADSERVALPVSGGVFVWSDRLDSVRAEAPCAVEAAWWRPAGHKLLLQCAPDYALEWDVESGEQAAAPQKKARSRSVLVPSLGLYVSPCEQLPCTAAPP